MNVFIQEQLQKYIKNLVGIYMTDQNGLDQVTISKERTVLPMSTTAYKYYDPDYMDWRCVIDKEEDGRIFILLVHKKPEEEWVKELAEVSK
jgi:hypothetical protein